MFKKTMIALFATLALIASIDAGANARPSGSDCEAGSAYAVPRC